MKTPSNKYKGKNRQQGQVIITTVLFFLAISFVVMIGIATPIANQLRDASDFIQSKQSYVAADALNDDGLYMLNQGKTLPSTYVLSFSGAAATATVADINGTKQISTIGTAGNLMRSSLSTFALGVGVAFNYGLQAGTGGFVLQGGAGIYGNVYSNGDIVGNGGGTFITGTAVAATLASPTADQQNNGATVPPYDVIFATSSSNRSIAQSFQVSSSSPLTSVTFYLKKTGYLADPTIKIVPDVSGSPSNSTVLATATLTGSTVTTSYGWVGVSFPTPPSLTVGSTYWIVIDSSSANVSNYLTIGATSGTYSSGAIKVGTLSGNTWSATSPSTLDMYFNIFLGGNTSSIGGMTIGSGGVGDARAYAVGTSTVAGTIYCQIGTGNNKSCDQSQADPAPADMPVSDGNITQWKTDAAAGTIHAGSWNVTSSTSTGATKVIGNLTVTSGATLTISGTLYVTGNILVNGGGKIVLDSSYNAGSGIVVTDGTITLTGGGQMGGSGQSTSYLMAVTTSTCDGITCGGSYAIDASGGAGSVVLVAQDGTVIFTGGTTANSAVGKKVIMTGGATITYKSGLASLNFTSGPSGAWTVSDWQEVAQ